MASNQTEHYGLNQWAAEDPVLREEFNRDFQLLDEILTGKGNCKIEVGSYDGTGTYNSTGANRLAFDGVPLVVIVHNDTCLFAFHGDGMGQILTNGGGWTVSLNWEGNSVSWYNRDDASKQMNAPGVRYYYLALLEANSEV